MALKFLSKEVRQIITDIENTITFLSKRYPPGNFCYAHCEENTNTVQPKKKSLTNFLNDAILKAVPYRRTNLERRWMRRIGHLKWFNKLLIPRKDLLICNRCGHDFQRGHLCPFCYQKVKVETEEIQDRIIKELGLNPVEQDVIVLYDNEKDQTPSEFWKGKRIIEMKKERPAWFSRNLLQKSTVGPSESTDVKPENLA